MVRCAREVARGRARLDDPDSDRRLLAIAEIGPWTIQCLGLHGRGEPDSLPPGDLAYVKLVGYLAGLAPRHRRGGRGVLRAVRAIPRAGGELRAGRLAQGDGSGPAGPARRLVTLHGRDRGGRQLARRQQLVAEDVVRRGRVRDQVMGRHPLRVHAPLRRSMKPNGRRGTLARSGRVASPPHGSGPGPAPCRPESTALAASGGCAIASPFPSPGRR